MRRTLITIALSGLLAACGGIADQSGGGQRGKGDNQGNYEVLITEDLDGQTIAANVGDTVKVWLAGNPTTGYQWNLLTNSRSMPLQEEGYVADEPIQTGSGGHQFFVFKPDTFAAGKTFELRLAYARSWESEPLKTFAVTLSVVPTCLPVMCELYCEYGFKTDEHGCGICECVDPFACNQDADCTLAKADCCGCQMGGTSIAVNKQYQSLFAPTPDQCTLGGSPIACMAVYMCFGSPVCVDGQCEIGGPLPQ